MARDSDVQKGNPEFEDCSEAIGLETQDILQAASFTNQMECFSLAITSNAMDFFCLFCKEAGSIEKEQEFLLLRDPTGFCCIFITNEEAA